MYNKQIQMHTFFLCMRFQPIKHPVNIFLFNKLIISVVICLRCNIPVLKMVQIHTCCFSLQ